MLSSVIVAADVVVSQEHTIDGRVVDCKMALARDKAPGPSRYLLHSLDLTVDFSFRCVLRFVLYPIKASWMRLTWFHRTETGKVFVGGLGVDLTNEEFANYFSRFGAIRVRATLKIF